MNGRRKKAAPSGAAAEEIRTLRAQGKKLLTAVENALPIITFAVHEHCHDLAGGNPDPGWEGTYQAMEAMEQAIAECTN